MTIPRSLLPVREICRVCVCGGGGEETKETVLKNLLINSDKFIEQVILLRFKTSLSVVSMCFSTIPFTFPAQGLTWDDKKANLIYKNRSEREGKQVENNIFLISLINFMVPMQRVANGRW